MPPCAPICRAIARQALAAASTAFPADGTDNSGDAGPGDRRVNAELSPNHLVLSADALDLLEPPIEPVPP